MLSLSWRGLRPCKQIALAGPSFAPIAKRFEKPSACPNRKPEAPQREPNISPFAAQNGPAPLAEETSQRDWRYFERSPTEEITAPVKRRKERHAQSSIRHGVEHSMRRCDHEEEPNQPRKLASP